MAEGLHVLVEGILDDRNHEVMARRVVMQHGATRDLGHFTYQTAGRIGITMRSQAVERGFEDDFSHLGTFQFLLTIRARCQAFGNEFQNGIRKIAGHDRWFVLWLVFSVVWPMASATAVILAYSRLFRIFAGFLRPVMARSALHAEVDRVPPVAVRPCATRSRQWRWRRKGVRPGESRRLRR
ncbi:hypothetical protein D3C84_346760 [compost metagenome]